MAAFWYDVLVQFFAQLLGGGLSSLLITVVPAAFLWVSRNLSHQPSDGHSGDAASARGGLNFVVSVVMRIVSVPILSVLYAYILVVAVIAVLVPFEVSTAKYSQEESVGFLTLLLFALLIFLLFFFTVRLSLERNFVQFSRAVWTYLIVASLVAFLGLRGWVMFEQSMQSAAMAIAYGIALAIVLVYLLMKPLEKASYD